MTTTNLYDFQVSAKLRELYNKQQDLTTERLNLAMSLTEKLGQAWLQAGGCNACLGHGLVVTWSTLDGPGYTEYGDCGCPAENRVKKPGSYWKGGWCAAVAGLVNFNDLLSLPEFHSEAILLNTYDLHIEANSLKIKDEEAKCEVSYGKPVVVVKGRKIPHGTEGECFWVGNDRFNKYNKRIGFRTASGDTMWTSLSNVKVKEAA